MEITTTIMQKQRAIEVAKELQKSDKVSRVNIYKWNDNSYAVEVSFKGKTGTQGIVSEARYNNIKRLIEQ